MVFREKKTINKNNIIGSEVLRNGDKKRWKNYIWDKLTFVGTLAISKYILTGVKTYMELVRIILRNECVFVWKSHKWRSSNRQNGNNCSTRPESISKTKKCKYTPKHMNHTIFIHQTTVYGLAMCICYTFFLFSIQNWYYYLVVLLL